MLLSNRLTYCITTFILLVAFAAVPVMAHQPPTGQTFDQAHDQEPNTPGGTLAPEEHPATDHHAAAPMVSSITLVDTMGLTPNIANDNTDGPTGADRLVSNVDGMTVYLVDDLDAADTARVIVEFSDADSDPNTPDTLPAGEFQLKITFDRGVYDVDAAGATASPPIDRDTVTDGADHLVLAGLTITASHANAPGINVASSRLGTVTVTRMDPTPEDTATNDLSTTEFLVTIPVTAGLAATNLPLSIWISVNENAVYSATQLVNGVVKQGRGNTASTPSPFMVANYADPGYTAPTDPPDTDGPDITAFSAPSAVDSDGNLTFTLTFDQSLGARGLLAGDLDVTGGTVVEVTPSGAASTYMVKVDPTSTNPDETEVIVTLKNNAVTDESGLPYTAPDSPMRGIFDNVNPTVMATATGVIGTGTGTDGNGIAVGMVKLSVTFSEELASMTDFRNADIDRTNSNVLLTNTEPMLATMPEDNKTVWELTVTPVPANAGQVVIVITAGSIADLTGNMLLQDTIVTWTRPGPDDDETDKPVVTIALPSGMTYIDSVSGGMVMITATDNTAVTNAVMDAEISVTNASKGNIANNQISVMPNVAATTVTVSVAAGAAMDAAGNGSDAVSKTFNVGPIFTVPAGNGNANPGYLVIVKDSTSDTALYLSDQPTLPPSPQHTDPPTPAPDIMVDEWSNMPDLERLFNTGPGSGGTLNIKAAATNVDATGNQVSTANVRITEVMSGIDEYLRGATNDAEAADQWVEVENPNSHDVKIIIYARTGRDSANTHIGNPDGHIDRIGNAYDGGPGSGPWAVPSENGNSYTGKDFKSMWRRYVENNRGKGYQNGTSKGAWSVSSNVYLTSATENPNDGNLYNHIGTPGRLQSVSLPEGDRRVNNPTNVPSSPFIINEVANRDNANAEYEWIEIKNVTNDRQRLRNYLISMVTATGTDTVLLEIDNGDNWVDANSVILLLASDPRDDEDHPIAVGYNVDVNVNDQVDGLGLNVEGSNRRAPRQKVVQFKNGGLPDGGDYVLILRRPDNHEGHRSGQDGGKGVAETGEADIDKIVDIAGSHRGLDKSNYPATSNPPNLNSTTLWPLHKFDGQMKPHYGHGDLNHRRHNRLEVNRVRYRQHVKTTAKNDADGSVSNRAGTGVTHKNEEVGHYAFRDAVYTGLGYKRTARVTGYNYGTPGYDGNSVGNTGIVKATAAAAKVTISEIMPATGPNADNPVFPQWVELFNSSPTDAVNLRGWKLRFETLDADGNPMDSLMDLNFNSSRSVKTIQPQQTVLIVAGNARQANSDSATGIDVFNENRVFNVYRDIGAGKFGANTRYMFFNPTAFSIQLLDKDNKVVDHIGNLDGDNRTSDTNKWDFPVGVAADGNRTSFLRIYDDGVARTGLNTAESNVVPIRSEDGKRLDKNGDGVADTNDKGMGIDMKYAWIPAVNTEREFKITIKSTWYGDEDDYGTPGHRVGLVLPVELSFFRPTLEDGVVTIRWTTESELDNAGFNIYRSEERNGEFKQVNSDLIEGAGTTGERSTYSWVDQTAKPGVIYYYQIEDVSFAGDRQPLAITKLKGLISAKNKLTTTWSELKEASQ